MPKVVLCAACAAAFALFNQARAQFVIQQDPVGDAVVRRAERGAGCPVDPTHHALPDIVSYRLGLWQPVAPQDELFAGEWSWSGQFLRFDLVLDGLANPPGTMGAGYPFDPFRYGPNPVFGYIEIDMDANVNTGGELDWPQLRYLGNAARFGGLPSDPRYAGRAASDYGAFDGDLSTFPLVERSGEEFHIALLGWDIQSIVRSNQDDMIFDPGETWLLTGTLFHRAHGYEPFSFACCTGNPGSYEPIVTLQFQHLLETDRTTISLVYPLTNAGSAAMRGEIQEQDPDGDAANQSSVLEALDDLVFSTLNALPGWMNDPGFDIISEWATADPSNSLDPSTWNVTLLLATGCVVPGADSIFVWTDIAPDVIAGDFNGDGRVDRADVALFDAFVASNDGVPGVDADQMVNGRVRLINFGPNFSVFDLDYNGIVEPLDRPVLDMPSDFDWDGDVDLADFMHFQACFNGPNRLPAGPGCADADLDHDVDVDLADFGWFQACFNGPNRTPKCVG